MTLFNLTDKQIESLVASREIYNQGVTLYTAGVVQNIRHDPHHRMITAKVAAERLYNVQLVLTVDSSLRFYYCTCPDYWENELPCPHIVALLKALQLNSQTSRPSLDILNQTIDDLLSSLISYPPENTCEELSLDVELSLAFRSRVMATVSFRLGAQRNYVVKDIGQLIQHVKDRRVLEFGKNFSYDPLRHRFHPTDQAIIAMLTDMLAQYTAIRETDATNYSPLLFNQKTLLLNNYYLKKLLDTLGDKPIFLEIQSDPVRSTSIQRQGLPLNFTLEAEEQDLLLRLECEELPLKLTDDGSYYYFQHNIYQITTAQSSMLPSFLDALRKSPTANLIIPSNKCERFVSEAIPCLKKTGTVTIDPRLTKQFNQEPLQIKIYFDRSGTNGIQARVEFHYGDTVINPFSARENDRAATVSDLIVIRAVEQERRLLDILEQADFMVSQGTIHLREEEQIFALAETWLPQLQDLAEIYYSDEFKLNIRTFTGLSGRVRLDESLNLLEISFAYHDIESAELTEVFRSLQLKKKYHRLQDGTFLPLNQPELCTVAHLLEHLNMNPADLTTETLTLPKFRAMYIDSFLRQANLPGLQRSKAFKQLVQSILEPQDGEFEIPPSLEPVLRDYQKTGFKWLKTLASYGLGGILADDMGLGKTLQVLAFILSEKSTDSEHSDIEPALVISPTSLIYNWQEEAAKFTPELKVIVIEGSPQERQIQLAEAIEYDLVVTSYPILRRDIEDFAQIDFSYCFLDEAQHIKNPQTINAKSVHQIKAKNYFALTGTPIENSLTELWSIFHFILPGYLLSHQEFRQKYEQPIIKGEDPLPLTELSRHVQPFILRRLKKDVLQELPAKIETQLNTFLTEDQKKIYLAYLQEAQKKIAQEIAAVGFERSQFKILAALTRLRQICCHPAMFIENYSGESGKMLLFQEILSEALAGGHRLLVFSQFTSMLEIIQNHLIAENIPYFYLNGSTNAQERIRMASAFNEGQGQVFLISLKAGGTGLNLVGADTVIHFDPWWNPAVEEQATDRAYRIGQKNPVQVIRLITQGTVEEKVSRLQARKKQLINAVIQPGETLLSKLSESELRDLFEI